MYFASWLKAVFHHWGILASGVAGVFFQMAERRGQVKGALARVLKWPRDEQGKPVVPKWWPINKWLCFILNNAFWVGGAGLIVFAMFSAWRDEHVNLLQTQHAAERTTNERRKSESRLEESQARIANLQDALLTTSNRLGTALLYISNMSSSIIVQGASLTNSTLKTAPEVANSFNFGTSNIFSGPMQIGSGNTMNITVTNSSGAVFKATLTRSIDSSEDKGNGKVVTKGRLHLVSPYPVGKLIVDVIGMGVEDVEVLSDSGGNMLNQQRFADGVLVEVPNAIGDYSFVIVTTNSSTFAIKYKVQ